jgi:Amidase
MRFEEYRRSDAVALAGLVGKGEVSAGELLDVAIDRAEAVNPKINAIVHKQYEQAHATIGKGLPNGPLAGVPYLIKDLSRPLRLANRRGLAVASMPISSPITTVAIRRAANASGWSLWVAVRHPNLASARAPSRAIWSLSQSVESGIFDRRLFGRGGRRSGSRHSTGCSCD